MQFAADVSTPLADADIDIEVLDAAQEHIRACRRDFELRISMPGTEVASSPTESRVDETFGYDHEAPEVFGSYDESLRKVLIEEMSSLKKKTALIGEVPVPPTLHLLSKRRKGRKVSESLLKPPRTLSKRLPLLP